MTIEAKDLIPGQMYGFNEVPEWILIAITENTTIWYCLSTGRVGVSDKFTSVEEYTERLSTSFEVIC